MGKSPKISPTQLPWQLIRNAQHLPFIAGYLKIHPDCEKLKSYVQKYTANRTVQGRLKEVNIGIETALEDLSLPPSP